jgi:hypothetical protein
MNSIDSLFYYGYRLLDTYKFDNPHLNWNIFDSEHLGKTSCESLEILGQALMCLSILQANTTLLK